jgi:AhpD family alkylhydroperoxidase
LDIVLLVVLPLAMKEEHEEGSRGNPLFAEMRRLSPKVTGGLLSMLQEAFRDGEIPAKYKLLAAMAISIAIRCEPCIRAYVELAHEKGISQKELLEFLEVAMTMQGCPGEEWSLKAYAVYKERAEGGQPTETCCVHSTEPADSLDL